MKTSNRTVCLTSQTFINNSKALLKLKCYNNGQKYKKPEAYRNTVKGIKEVLYNMPINARMGLLKLKMVQNCEPVYAPKAVTKAKPLSSAEAYKKTVISESCFSEEYQATNNALDALCLNSEANKKDDHIANLTTLHNGFNDLTRKDKATIWVQSMADREALGLKTWANPYTR